MVVLNVKIGRRPPNPNEILAELYRQNDLAQAKFDRQKIWAQATFYCTCALIAVLAVVDMVLRW